VTLDERVDERSGPVGSRRGLPSRLGHWEPIQMRDAKLFATPSMSTETLTELPAHAGSGSWEGGRS
jgi:hypothetical protein